jgi:3-isopropylmalate/(R)-2-methylmalate dehydratase small subunit
LAQGIFYDLRYDAAGAERPDFILNRPAYRKPVFLAVGPNFGCGSSREHAVWGLQQFGIRALIGSSFASIFQDNCFRNGLLPLSLPPDRAQQVQSVSADPAHNTLEVDLEAQAIFLDDGTRIDFAIDPLRKGDLLSGRDAIAATLRYAAEIANFEREHWAAQPWQNPSLPDR